MSRFDMTAAIEVYAEVAGILSGFSCAILVLSIDRFARRLPNLR